MAVGDIGLRLKTAREDKRPKMKQSDLARRLGVSQGRLGNWERGKHDPPGDIVAKAAKILERSLDYFYGEESSTEIGRTSSTIGELNNQNSGIDSGLESQLADLTDTVSDPRIIRAKVPVVSGAGIWSAKGAEVRVIPMQAFIVAGKRLVKLVDPDTSLNFQDGAVLAFQPDDYPRPDTYLLLRDKLNPDNHVIRFIDPMRDGTLLLADDVAMAPLHLRDWSVVGFAWAEIHGAGTDAPRMVIRPDGFGPRRR